MFIRYCQRWELLTYTNCWLSSSSSSSSVVLNNQWRKANSQWRMSLFIITATTPLTGVRLHRADSYETILRRWRTPIIIIIITGTVTVWWIWRLLATSHTDSVLLLWRLRQRKPACQLQLINIKSDILLWDFYLNMHIQRLSLIH